jgi:soluble lytic murein transglycosylase
MSAQAHPRGRTGSGAKRRPTKAERERRKRVLRRRLMLLTFAVVASCVALAVILRPFAEDAVQEISLPLRHEDIIRQQAQDKGVDPSLIAGVIYVESRFRDQTSQAGAKGLMQIMPATADYIASKSGGTAFEQGDLATPQINISYGSWYLRYLLDHYHGNELLALAAYNAGEGKVDEWYRDASARGEDFEAATHIPFPETRSYVGSVLEVRSRYRQEYRRELGL